MTFKRRGKASQARHLDRAARGVFLATQQLVSGNGKDSASFHSGHLEHGEVSCQEKDICSATCHLLSHAAFAQPRGTCSTHTAEFPFTNSQHLQKQSNATAWRLKDRRVTRPSSNFSRGHSTPCALGQCQQPKPLPKLIVMLESTNC